MMNGLIARSKYDLGHSNIIEYHIVINEFGIETYSIKLNDKVNTDNLISKHTYL